ncbi:MAG: efflux RND transporter periplasmic adaptor subunit [Nitrospinota bacterium]|nr:efflux RND transporter periplasmic adaptor subunit [Nitrospinota bacterium]
MNRKSLSIIIILAVGVALAVMILQIKPPMVHEHEEPTGHSVAEEQGHSEEGETEAQERAEERGPHGGRLFAEGNLKLEVTIFERNVPPQFRVYATDTQGKTIPLDQIQLTIDLNRLERTDHIQFNPSGEYLLGDQVVVEPHSFDIQIKATWQGKSHQWQYSQIEARSEISEEAARNAGIATTQAGPGEIHQVVQLNGEIGLHEKRVAHVVPRLDAMVTRVKKDLGDPVKKGDILAILDSRELADAKSEYLTTVKQAEPAQVELERQELINKNTQIMLDLLREGLDLDTLYKKINQLVLGESRAQIVPAYATLIRSKAVYEREQSLFKKKISSRSEYLLAMEEYQSAEARYLALREKISYDNQLALLEKQKALEKANLEIKTLGQKLQALGLTSREINNLSHEQKARFTRFELRAAIDGEVIQKHIAVGESVKKDFDVFVLADLTEVWVNIAVPAKYLNVVRLGQQVTVREDKLGLEARGKLTYLGALIDEKTRTVTGRVVISNKKRLWRPGMYVTVDLVQASRKVPLAVPVNAIQTIRDWSVVFIKVGNQYEARPLELGENDGTLVEVLNGIQPGDEYVHQNSFAVKAEIGKSAATHDH